MRFLQEKNRLNWTQNELTRNTSITRQTGSNNKNKYTKNRKRTKIFSWGNIIPFKKILKKLTSEHRYSEKINEEEQRLELDRRTYERIQQTERIHHEYPMSRTLQCNY